MSRRLLKAAEAIREVVASTILTEVRDPRVKDVTVIGVEVSPDMREAKVSVSVMGSESQQQLAIRGLQNCAGFLQAKIANRIDARYTPKLTFKLDKGLQNALVVSELLNKIKQEKTGAESPEALPSDQDDEPNEGVQSSEQAEASDDDSNPSQDGTQA
ncbi:ribosome-binding factor A [Rhodopirellula maiorica SM1]|uniref:Ribosome-binding factor A n=1 Tax=Rhodopirellula maiorica SM1 TaxID=1265738 RepID=M5RG94_9BACT|nr:30S ribosome-binding factor RbfA [Rhodopirellula maiorica]EMI18340.1 ribosome-binding factor A [Rhodopirellula maiorica SM1]